MTKLDNTPNQFGISPALKASLNYVQRALMLPQELKEMGQNIEIILLEKDSHCAGL